MTQNKFYKSAKADILGDGFGVFLDGRRLVTPAKNPLILPSLAAARLVAQEWDAQKDVIDTNTMPITRLVNVAIDRAPTTREGLVDEVRKYASSDLCCYRTTSPAILYQTQCEIWDSHINWVKAKYNIEFATKADSFELFQSQETLDKIAKLAAEFDNLRLTIFAFVTALAGSTILALRLVDGEATPEDIFKAIRIEEDHNAKIWGYDDEDLSKAKAKMDDLKCAYSLIHAI